MTNTRNFPVEWLFDLRSSVIFLPEIKDSRTVLYAKASTGHHFSLTNAWSTIINKTLGLMPWQLSYLQKKKEIKKYLIVIWKLVFVFCVKYTICLVLLFVSNYEMLIYYGINCRNHWLFTRHFWVDRALLANKHQEWYRFIFLVIISADASCSVWFIIFKLLILRIN